MSTCLTFSGEESSSQLDATRFCGYGFLGVQHVIDIPMAVLRMPFQFSTMVFSNYMLAVLNLARRFVRDAVINEKFLRAVFEHQ